MRVLVGSVAARSVLAVSPTGCGGGPSVAKAGGGSTGGGMSPYERVDRGWIRPSPAYWSHLARRQGGTVPENAAGPSPPAPRWPARCRTP